MEYPELAARTRGFTSGAPRAVTVTAGGQKVIFLRSADATSRRDALWVFDVAHARERLVFDPSSTPGTPDAELAGPSDAERALRERQRLSTAGIGSYATDRAGRIAAFAVDGHLTVVDVDTASVRTGIDIDGALEARPDPTGARVAYVRGNCLYVLDLDTLTSNLIAGEPDNSEVTWGLAEFIAAEEFNRYAGYWWSPDGSCLLAARVDHTRVTRWHLHDPADPGRAATTVAYPSAGTANAEITLHLLDLDGGWVDVHWDRETYPYLAAVSWSEAGGPLITVLRRLQQHGLILSIDARTGETQVHAELADPRWVDPVPGTPAYLPDGRVLLGGELAHDGYDARCLFADGALLTPPALYVRRVCGQLGSDLLVEASEAQPGEVHLYRVATRSSSAITDVQRLTTNPGWHTGHANGTTLVVGAQALDHSGTQWTIFAEGREIGRLASFATPPPYAPRPHLDRVTDRSLPTGVLYPRSHVAGRRLAVLVDIYGGPGHQEVVNRRSAWVERQWWADSGFAVVVIDNRGTPGVAPSFEKVIHRRMADVILADQVDALAALADKHPDLDLSRVAIRGWSFGGWLAALAVLRRPDVFHCAVAGAPVTDWTLYDTAYTERYLGLPDDAGEVYAHNSLIEYAQERPAPGEPMRPMLLIHGMVDDNVVVAHTLRLSAAMLVAGRPHSMIPLTGATHLAAGGVAQQLLRLERDFIRRGLGADADV